ncbi:MAG: Hpt domain-containing protein, partial [Candidatus Adiutrix sp.]|nr:Hpt domain-containing protein [Candidatus Adiutrix sp.]
MSEMELDPGLLQDFITESAELLEAYTSSLTAFESDSTNLDIINPVFRAAHTLKGSSAFFGLNRIKDFSHKLENLLDDIRHHTRTADSKAIEYLFLAGKHLKDMFERLSAGDLRIELLPEEAAFQDELVAWMGGGAAAGAAQFEEACRKIKTMLAEAMEEAKEPGQLVEDIMGVINPLPLTLAGPGGGQDAGQKQPDPVAVGFRGVDLTVPALSALANIKGQSFDPAAYEADLKALADEVEKNGWSEVQPLLKDAQEDFIAIRESGLDFDPVLCSVLGGKYQAFLDALELTFPEAAPAAPAAAAAQGPAG